MNSVKDIGSEMECVKLGMRHTKDGHILSIVMHPNDTPEDILRDPVGQRYMAVFVRVNDHEEAVASPQVEDGLKAVKLAGTLCSDADFQLWMASKGYATGVSEEAATEGMRAYLGVTSRKELKTDADARAVLSRLRSAFVAEYRGGR